MWRRSVVVLQCRSPLLFFLFSSSLPSFLRPLEGLRARRRGGCRSAGRKPFLELVLELRPNFQTRPAGSRTTDSVRGRGGESSCGTHRRRTEVQHRQCERRRKAPPSRARRRRRGIGSSPPRGPNAASRRGRGGRGGGPAPRDADQRRRWRRARERRGGRLRRHVAAAAGRRPTPPQGLRQADLPLLPGRLRGMGRVSGARGHRHRHGPRDPAPPHGRAAAAGALRRLAALHPLRQLRLRHDAPAAPRHGGDTCAKRGAREVPGLEEPGPTGQRAYAWYPANVESPPEGGWPVLVFAHGMTGGGEELEQAYPQTWEVASWARILLEPPARRPSSRAEDVGRRQLLERGASPRHSRRTRPPSSTPRLD
eukprot:COSAG04_NODE_290_length_17835_cov_11.494982_2_plen_367_part_00